jgi:hypothetical protein
MVLFFPLSPADIAEIAIIPNHLLPFVRDMGAHGSQPLQRIKHLTHYEE